MVKHLAAALDADCVYIGEFAGGQVEQVRVLAASVEPKQEREFDYALAGSASAAAALGKRCVCRAGARNEFPDDAILVRFAAQAFLGLPLIHCDSHPIGILMALYSRSVHSFAAQTTLLEIFAPRAAAELNRKHTEEQLRESEQRYRAFIATNPDGMWRVELDPPVPTNLSMVEQGERIHRDGYVAECNDALARLAGRSRAGELVGVRVSELVDPDGDASIRKATLAAVQAGYGLITSETELPDRGGRKRYFLRSQWGVVEDGALRRIWGVTRDITQIRNSELELQASERRMADVLEAVHMVVMMLDLDGSITYCNDYFLRLTGWEFDQIAGKNWIDLMIPENERPVITAALESVRTGVPSPMHLKSTLLGPGGRRWWIAWDFTVLADAAGHAASAVFLGRDATEHKQLEDQLRQAQKLESVGRLAGGLAHDFNNLLTVILGYSSAMMANLDPADPTYVPLSEIRKAAEKGSDLAYQLLTFSSRRGSRPSLLNLNLIIVEDHRMLRRLIGESIDLVTELDPGLGNIRADAGHIRQVLMNLAVNARDAMLNGGKLVISSSNVDTGGGKPWAGLPAGRYVMLSVSDSGVGMSEDVHNHCFEPFFTTKPPGKGTGLGLSTVYGIVRESSGHIFVDTAPDKGTTFKILFPRVDDPSQTPEAVPQPLVSGGRESILLVEDNYDVRVLTGKTLRQLGYRVRDAEGAGHALELAQHGGEHFDLLLTDLVMPQMGGTELAEFIRLAQPGIKVLFMSGYPGGSESDPVELPRDDQYIQKPFTPEKLASKVREILDRT
jgi:PAS domain S-box-containing protein